MAETSTKRDEVDSDYDDGGSSWGGPLFAVIFFIFSPLTVLSAVATYLAFAWQKIRLSAIFWFSLVPYLLILSLFHNFVIEQFTTSWTTTIPGIISQQTEILPGLINVFLQQALLAIPLGIIIGMIYSAHRYRAQPVWVKTEFRLTPFEYFMKRKNIKDIKSDKNTPREGMTLGIDKYGKKVIQTYQESAAHTIILGASGTGKTTTIISRLRDSIKAGQGAVIIDLKGSVDLPLRTAELAKRYNRKFTHWLLQPKGLEYNGPAEDGPAYYDPIARGEATRRKDLLIESREWTEEYYKQESSNYLQLLFNVLVANPKENTSTLSDVVNLLNPLVLQERAIPLGTNPDYSDIIRSIDALNDEKLSPGKRSAIDSLKSQLEVLLHSVAGRFLQLDPKGNNNINLKKAAHNGEIIFFSLDSSNYGELAALVANLIIQDLKTVSSELRQDPADKPFQVIIDEFSAIGSENIIGLVNKSRDANMPVTLATQALGDLKAVSPVFLDQLLGIINSFIIHRPNTKVDAEVSAGLTGTVTRKRFNESVVYSGGLMTKGGVKGVGSVEDIEEYAVMPNEIQHLKTGEMIYVNKSPMRIERVLCVPEDKSLVKETALEENVIEKSFRNDSGDLLTVEETISKPTDGFVTPPANAAPIKSTPVNRPTRPNTMPQPSTPYATKFSEDEQTNVPSRPANKDRLREIMNQSPETLLPKSARTDTFTVTHMPPKVSEPLAPVQRPTLPALPKKLPPLPAPPAKNTLPPLPQPKKEEKPNSGKDEFDF